MWKFALFSCLAVLALSGERVASLEGGQTTRGAILRGTRLIAWGGAAYEWDTRTWKRRVLAKAPGGFGEGGCLDARGGLLLQEGVEGGPLVLFSNRGQREVWDRRVDMHDCVFTTLFGRPGVLITNHYGQVRFYEGPGKYREIYSFYTSSRQSGLLRRDMDRDGFMDIVCGNYWIRSPKESGLPWRLFAINTRHETPDSATMTLVFHGSELYAAQGHMKSGSVFRYRPVSDVTQLWEEDLVADGLRYPHAIAAGDFGVVVAENDGTGSGVLLAAPGRRFERIGTTDGVHSAFEWGGRVLLVGARTVELWDVQRRK